MCPTAVGRSILGLQNFLIGAPALRQWRVRKGCTGFDEHAPELSLDPIGCIPDFTDASKMTEGAAFRSAEGGFSSRIPSLWDADDAAEFGFCTTAHDVDGILLDPLERFVGRGCSFDAALPPQAGAWAKKVASLKRYTFIDLQTRHVSLVIPAYNANNDLFVSIRLACTFDPSGGVACSADVPVFRFTFPLDGTADRSLFRQVVATIASLFIFLTVLWRVYDFSITVMVVSNGELIKNAVWILPTHCGCVFVRAAHNEARAAASQRQGEIGVKPTEFNSEAAKEDAAIIAENLDMARNPHGSICNLIDWVSFAWFGVSTFLHSSFDFACLEKLGAVSPSISQQALWESVDLIGLSQTYRHVLRVDAVMLILLFIKVFKFLDGNPMIQRVGNYFVASVSMFFNTCIILLVLGGALYLFGYLMFADGSVIFRDGGFLYGTFMNAKRARMDVGYFGGFMQGWDIFFITIAVINTVAVNSFFIAILNFVVVQEEKPSRQAEALRS
jgi:hypothetical protein